MLVLTGFMPCNAGRAENRVAVCGKSKCADVPVIGINRNATEYRCVSIYLKLRKNGAGRKAPTDRGAGY